MDSQEVSRLTLQPVRSVLGVALGLVTLAAAIATLLGYPWGRPFLLALSIVCSLWIATHCVSKAFAFHAALVHTQTQLGQANDAMYDQLMHFIDSLGPVVGQSVMEIACARVIAGRTLSVQTVRTGRGWIQLRLDAGAIDGLWQQAKLHVSYQDSRAHEDLGTWPAQVRREVAFVMMQLDPSTLHAIQPICPSKFTIRVIEPQPSHPAIALLADLLSEVERARMFPDRSSHAPDGGAIRGLRIGWLWLLVVPRDSLPSRHGSAETGSHEVLRDQKSG